MRVERHNTEHSNGDSLKNISVSKRIRTVTKTAKSPPSVRNQSNFKGKKITYRKQAKQKGKGESNPYISQHQDQQTKDIAVKNKEVPHRKVT